MSTKTITMSSGQTIHTSVKKGDTCRYSPLLIMNGIGANLSLLSPFVDALHKSNPDIEIITFDCPGVGGSSTPCLPYRFSGLSKIVAEMLDVLGYDKVNVLGLSWGGMASQQFAYDYPERVRKLILAATCAGVLSVPPSLRVLSLMASPRRYTDSEYMIKVSPEIYGGKFKHDKELARKHAEKMNNSEGDERSSLGYAYQVGAVYWWSSLPWLNKIKQPTLILAGSDDPLIPLVNMKVLNKMIPNTEMHVFEDGHLFLLSSVEEVMPILKKFLEGE